MSIERYKPKLIVEDHLQRNDLVIKFIDELDGPVEQMGAWKLFRFLCKHYPKLKGNVIAHRTWEG